MNEYLEAGYRLIRDSAPDHVPVLQGVSADANAWWFSNPHKLLLYPAWHMLEDQRANGHPHACEIYDAVLAAGIAARLSR